MSHDVDAIYDQGVFRPLQPLVLPEGTQVHLHVEESLTARHEPNHVGRIYSPRLANPQQAGDFVMEAREAPHAGV